ncbi:MAG: hypothetical protein MK165_21890 [Pirellulaceae bacterium]|nr:hypothetical protein [Pirellulaceae bacterium]
MSRLRMRQLAGLLWLIVTVGWFVQVVPSWSDGFWRLAASLGVLGFSWVVVTVFGPRLMEKLKRPLQWLVAREGARLGLTFGLAGLLCVLTSWLVFPEPNWHDEFSYLLAADTFSQGRLANPPHAMWEHLETFHVLQQPTYVSKYPPAHGFVLALGQWIGGHPVWGVWLATACCAASITWMLNGWVAARWSLLGGLLVALHPGLLFSWGQNYMGGQIAAIGGALLFGAVPRLRRKLSIRLSLVMTVGIAMLANSRPYEGLVTCLPVAGWLIGWTAWQLRTSWQPLLLRFLLPTVTGFVLMVGGMAFYNVRTTGDPLQMPYMRYTQDYNVTPLFFWSPEVAPPDRQLPFVRSTQVSRPGFWPDRKQKQSIRSSRFYFGFVVLCPALVVPLLVVPGSLWLRGATLAMITMTGLIIAECLSYSWHPHYLAPALPLFILLVVQGLRVLRRCFQSKQRTTGGVIPTLLLAQFLLTGLAFAYYPIHHASAPQDWHSDRAEMLSQLRGIAGDHLVIVRYAEDHYVHHEWVYNRADIDGAKVVWARELGAAQDKELLRYFVDRQLWLLHADESPPRLIPHPDYDTARPKSS